MKKFLARPVVLLCSLAIVVWVWGTLPRWDGSISPAAMAEPSADAAQAPERNVILVLVDGLRWQEVFAGAEEALIDKKVGGVDDVAGLRKQFWRDTPEARREALMPFFWNVIAKKGQLIGNQAAGSVATVTNNFHFSYPGYSEMICGFADPRINSNEYPPNPNVTVLEWLHQQPGFDGRVAAFGVWDTVANIVNSGRCGFFVNTGWNPVPDEIAQSDNAKLLNDLKANLPRTDGTPDAITFRAALEYLKHHQPRVMFFTFGETDHFAHAGQYDVYLHAAHNNDRMMRRLWETVQSMEGYRDNTTLIIASDHGRGSGLTDWRHHGTKYVGADSIWTAIIGPDTPAAGMWGGDADGDNPPVAVTQSQIAATVAAAVREDYCAAQPKAAAPIPGVVKVGAP